MKKLLLALLLCTNVTNASIFGSSKVSRLKDAIQAVKNERDASLSKVVALQHSVDDLETENQVLRSALISFKYQNLEMAALIKEYQDRFEQKMIELSDATALLVHTEKELNEMMSIPETLLKD